MFHFVWVKGHAALWCGTIREYVDFFIAFFNIFTSAVSYVKQAGDG